MKNILCYGDSNTFGYKPDNSGRFEKPERWTGILQSMLGENCNIIEEGLCGRTTAFNDSASGQRNGLEYLPVSLDTHQPLDMVIVMLGTNDCKSEYLPNAEKIAAGIESIINLIREHHYYIGKTPEILLISPACLKKGVSDYESNYGEYSVMVSQKLAGEYKHLSDKYACKFLDAGSFAECGLDCQHLDKNGHKALAEHIYELIK